MPALVKYQKIALELRKRIANGQYVDRLPPRRQLMQEFNISSRTLHKVFAELKLCGIIEPTARGCWLKKHSATALPKPGRILLATFKAAELANSDYLIKPLVAEIRANGFEVIFCDVLQQSVVEAVQANALGAADGVIFAYSTFNVEAADFLKNLHIPFVSANRPKAGTLINWVDWDHEELFNEFVSNMRMRGARSLDIFWQQQKTVELNNHTGIIGDFRAVKRSFLLFNHELDAFPERDFGNLEKYADHLCKLKHLPDVVWVVDDSRDMLAEKLHSRGISATDFLITLNRSRGQKNSVAFYTPQAYAALAHKVWKLLCYLRRHPNSEPRHFKQRCEVKFYEKNYRHLAK